MDVERLSGDVAVVVTSGHQLGQHQPEQCIRGVAGDGSGGPHRLHRGDGPRVVGDRVGQKKPGEPLGTLRYRNLCHAPTEVVTDEHRPVDADGVEPGQQVLRLAGDRNVATPPMHDRFPITDHLPSQHTGIQLRRDVAPQRRRGRDAVHQHHRRARAALLPTHADAIDGHGVRLHASSRPRRLSRCPCRRAANRHRHLPYRQRSSSGAGSAGALDRAA